MRYSEHEQRLMDQASGDEQDRHTRAQIKGIVRRQNERREAVRASNARDTTWCCSMDAEQCFKDLEALMIYLGVK